MLILGYNVFMDPYQKGLLREQRIVAKVIIPRRVVVTTDEGRKYMRNRMFIRKQNSEDKETTRKVSDEVQMYYRISSRHVVHVQEEFPSSLRDFTLKVF
ncbi:hypothetical protein NPIL_445411 [Nephila pilipes]|uniref:Uncharacterized protein n=1 Tax=Nephila pilipes TaxID=299642 RepID=A0A8X6Q141_NEPPI|nr:hypothetical protein NPIL_445411 [Nephila pilipes]